MVVEGASPPTTLGSLCDAENESETGRAALAPDETIRGGTESGTALAARTEPLEDLQEEIAPLAPASRELSW